MSKVKKTVNFSESSNEKLLEMSNQLKIPYTYILEDLIEGLYVKYTASNLTKNVNVIRMLIDEQ